MASQNISILSLAVLATAALAVHRFVTVGGAIATAAGNAIGVTRFEAADGEAVTVDVIGTAKVEAAAAIAKGAAIQVGTNGRAVTATSGTVVARALEAAAAEGDIIEVLLIAN